MSHTKRPNDLDCLSAKLAEPQKDSDSYILPALIISSAISFLSSSGASTSHSGPQLRIHGFISSVCFTLSRNRQPPSGSSVTATTPGQSAPPTEVRGDYSSPPQHEGQLQLSAVQPCFLKFQSTPLHSTVGQTVHDRPERPAAPANVVESRGTSAVRNR